MGKSLDPLRHIGKGVTGHLRMLPLSLLLLSITAFSSAQSQDVITLKLSQILKDQSVNDREFKYYSLKLEGKNYDNEKDLFIQVHPLDPMKEPQVFMSKSTTRPNTVQNSDWVCSKYGKDTCQVHHQNISAQGDTMIYMGVKCDGGCKFLIKPFMQDEITLSDGVETTIEFGVMESKIFKMYIPANTTTNDEDNKVSSITVTAASHLTLGDESLKLRVYTVRNSMQEEGMNRPPSTSQMKEGSPGWRKGQTLRISNKNKGWCTDCWLYILVDAAEAGRYLIKAKSNLGQMQLFDGRKVDDVAHIEENVCYKYYVKSRDTDVYVKVSQFSGLISYGLSPKKIPIDYEDAVFKNIGTQNSALVVSGRERQAKGDATGQYYLCVFPIMTSTYSIMIQEKPSNIQFKFLDEGYEEVGEVQGKNLTVYMYKVPPLDYDSEDISLEFVLSTISGNQPKLAAKQCKKFREYKNCAEELLISNNPSSEVLNPSSGFEQGKLASNTETSLIIDHDEQQCKEAYMGECYYTVVVLGTGQDNQFSKFKLSAIPQQLNYYILKEGGLINDYIKLGSIRYYSFTLPDSKGVKSVKFLLNSLHGDADLYVSRKHKKPHKGDNEKSSVRMGGLVDEITFDGSNLAATYYVGVFSYQYSTYSLLVKVDRGEEPAFDSTPYLQEGIPQSGSIHNELEEEHYRFEVNQIEGFEKNIKIQVTPIEGSVSVMVSYNERPSVQNYMWSSNDNYIEIKTNDKNFHRQGQYFIKVVPNYSFWDLFIDNYYKYMIYYATSDAYLYLQTKTPLEHKQGANSRQILRHFITNFQEDISLSMTVFSGSPILYVAFDPSKKFPSKESNDFNTKQQALMQGTKGKALYFTQSAISQLNSQCQEYAQKFDEPCVMYAAVECADECKYALKLTYDNSGPQQLIVGVPQHSVVKEGQFNYYYIIVKQNKTSQLYADLTSMKGNGDLYVNLQENPQLSSPDAWDMPTTNDYQLKSVAVEGTDNVKISKQDLDNCYSDFDQNKYGSDPLCAIIFGVYAAPSNKIAVGDPSNLQELEEYLTRYNLIVYTDMQQLMSMTPINGQVDQGAFQYYMYEATCDECTVIVSLSTTGGDPDLYVNFGETTPPTVTDHHFQSTTYRSELIQIDLKNTYFQKNNLKSIKGKYIIGVYGRKKSNFTLSVIQEKYPTNLLIESQAQNHKQDAFEEKYFLWYNSYDTKDIKINISPKIGSVDIYVTTYNENDETQNLGLKLPSSKKKATWVLSDLTSLSSISNRELLILNNEREYCTECFFIIGVITHEKFSEYQITLSTLDANYLNSQLMRVGEVYEQSLKASESKIYKFILDDTSSLQIIQTVHKGQASSVVSFNENGDHSLFELTNSQTITLKSEDKNFETEKIYYILVSAKTDAEFSLLVMQDQSILRLSDGLPQKIVYTDSKDVAKHIVYKLPDGDYTININVISKTKGFYPRLYLKYYADIDLEMKTLEFPPGGPGEFYTYSKWDTKLGVLTYSERFPNVKSNGKAGLAISLFDIGLRRDSAEAIVTITTSSVAKIVANNNYLGHLEHFSSFIIYQIEPSEFPKKKYLNIELAQCLGRVELSVIDNPSNIYSKSTAIDESKIQFIPFILGRDHYVIPMPQQTVYILIRPKILESSRFDLDGGESTDFQLKIKPSEEPFYQNIDFMLQNNGTINYNLDKDLQGFNISWGRVYHPDSSGRMSTKDTKYHLVVSKDERAFLYSTCALSKEFRQKHLSSSIDTKNTSFFFSNLERGQTFYMNVIAQFSIEGEDESYFVPYVPIVVKVPTQQSVFSKLAIWSYVFLGCLFLGGVLYFGKKTKDIARQVEQELEMQNVRPSSGSRSNQHYQRGIDVTPQSSYNVRYEQLENTGSGSYQPAALTEINP